MPPENNANKNNPGMGAFNVGIDPVFRGNPNMQTKAPNQGAPLSAYGALTSQQYVPNTPPVSTPKPVINTNTGPKSIIRTYKGDLESAIQTEHLSSINIAIAENQKMHNQIRTETQTEESAPSEYSKSKVIIFISVAFIIAGIAGVTLTFLFKSPATDSVVQIQELPSLITTEYKGELNIDTTVKDKLIGTLASKLNDSQITVNNLYNIYITIGTSSKKIITSGQFVSLMGFKMPDIVKRTLLPDFMVGTFSFGRNLPFIILKSSYFENAYAGMLAWEKDLEKDMQILFRLPGYDNNGGILSDLTPTTSKNFVDGVIINKDVRLLRGDDGEIMLLYGIIDKETIIITVSDVAFKELINRLNKEKGLKR